MSKVMIEDTTLTSIADSIRDKNGTSGKILPSAMASMISSISGGGGSPLVEAGTFTLSESTKNIEIKHTLGVEPYLIVFIARGNAGNHGGQSDVEYGIICNDKTFNNTKVFGGQVRYWATNTSVVGFSNTELDFNKESLKITEIDSSKTGSFNLWKFGSGIQYDWIMCAKPQED